MLDAQQAPIVVPPFTDIVVNEIGELSIQPPDAPPGERVLVATLGTYVPDGTQVLRKGEDGQIRLENGQVPPSNQLAEVRQGVLERSNVNTTDELINAIDLQRGFELNMKMVSEAKRLDEAAGSLVKLPEG
ncbi:flagellar basal body rod C-terminal domain-containing protein [Gemmobacter lanyuensis]